MKKFILVIITLLLSDLALACSPARPSAERLNDIRPTIITSPNKQFFLKLVPSRWKKKSAVIKRIKDSYAIAFEVLPDGQFKQLWSFKFWDNRETHSWFSKVKRPDFYLSDDGMNLVEINAVQHNNDKSAVVMYKKGKKVKRYAPMDFGINKLKVGPTSCRFKSWIMYSENRRANDRATEVNIRTVDNVLWHIDPDSLKFRKAQ